MKDIAEFALDIAALHGADNAEVRVVQQKAEKIGMRNNAPTDFESDESQGIGVKVYLNGYWGFASSYLLDKSNVEATVQRAITNSEASALLQRAPVPRVDEPVHVERWRMPIHHDPFKVALEDKLGLLEQIYQEAARVRGVQTVIGNMAFQRRHQFFVNTEGSRIEQLSYLSGIGFQVIASNGRDAQIRSYPNSFGGQWAAMGYELIYQWPLLENAQRIAEEAVALLSAPDCPARTCDLILDGSQLAVQMHESCGHPLELDRALGHEANFAGTSFLTPDQRHRLQFGSEQVNIYCDARPSHANGAGTFAYDDEGVAAQRTDLIKNGMFVNFLYSRDTAAYIEAERSNGCVRASGWQRAPIIRMTNLCLEPGDWTIEEVIADTRDGVYLETNRSWSMDDQRTSFQFGTEIAWEIKGGKKERILKNPTYGGSTTAFWRSCDAICSKEEWQLWGLANCGKGQPEQILATSHGAAPARFRNVSIGVGHVQ